MKGRIRTQGLYRLISNILSLGVKANICKRAFRSFNFAKGFQKTLPKASKISKGFHCSITKLDCSCNTNAKNLKKKHNSKTLNET